MIQRLRLKLHLLTSQLSMLSWATGAIIWKERKQLRSSWDCWRAVMFIASKISSVDIINAVKMRNISITRISVVRTLSLRPSQAMSFRSALSAVQTTSTRSSKMSKVSSSMRLRRDSLPSTCKLIRTSMLDQYQLQPTFVRICRLPKTLTSRECGHIWETTWWAWRESRKTPFQPTSNIFGCIRRPKSCQPNEHKPIDLHWISLLFTIKKYPWYMTARFSNMAICI